MQVFWGLILSALFLAALFGSGLSWDGSYILFKVLDTQSPFWANNRIVHAPFHLIVLLANRFTGDLNILKFVFSSVYAAVPLLSLALSWLILRHRAPGLFIWAVLGIALSALPGQFFFVSEAVFVSQVFWPITLILLTDTFKEHFLLITACSIFAFFAHPGASLLFGFAALGLFLMGLRHPHRRVQMWSLASASIILSVARLCMLTLSSYEREQLSLSLMLWRFHAAVAGLPLMSLIGGYLAGLAICLSPFLRKPESQRLSAFTNLISLFLIVASGGALLIWARDSKLWMYELDFRFMAPFASLPFFALAAFEGIVYAPGFFKEKHFQFRSKIIEIAALIFLVVLAVQSTVWFNLTNRLYETISQNSGTCISKTSLKWIEPTPLRHWSTPAYAILLQGRKPWMLLLDQGGCEELSEGVRIAQWDLRKYAEGWFVLPHLSKPSNSEEKSSGLQ